MKKLLINIIFIFITFIIPSNIYAISTKDAKELIDINKLGSLTINYSYDNYHFDKTNVSIYYIASVTTDFKYQLSSDFMNYPVKINGINSDEEWNILKQTLNSYIEVDNINETIKESIKANTVLIKNLKPGLYLVKTNKINTDNYQLLFDSFLISIPNLEENGQWNYDVTVYPKAKSYLPKYEEITYTVIKKWQDNKKNRPKNIEIEIYKNNILINTQLLSNHNDWTYKWNALDDGSNWIVVERNIPSNYNVSISKENNHFNIINTDNLYQEESPKTFDHINIYFYLSLVSILALSLLITLKIKRIK